MTVYGRITFEAFSRPRVAELTSTGWHVESEAWLAELLDTLAPMSDFGAADGDPAVCALERAAKILTGTYELAERPGPPAGTVY